MKQESLNKASEAILDSLDKLDIEPSDKLELLMNLKTMLESVKSYEDARDILIKTSIRKKFSDKVFRR